MSADRWGPNPMGFAEFVVRHGAEVLHADYLARADYAGDEVTWEDFAEQSLRVLTAALTGTRWEDY
jgi:hypothetical protein